MTGVGAPPRFRDDVRRLVALAGGGLLAGILAKAADESGLPWAADLGSYPAVWVLAVAVIGRVAPTAAFAAARAAVFFGAMTVAYYGWAAWVLDLGSDRDLVVIWLLLSATVVAVFSMAAWWSTRQPGPLAGALVALVAGTAMLRGAAPAAWAARAGGNVPAHLVQAVVEVVVVLVVLVLPRHRSTRLWAVVLVLPIWWLVQQFLDGLAYGTGVIG